MAKVEKKKGVKRPQENQNEKLVQAKEVCSKVLEASREWTSRDELKLPALKEIRSAAAQFLGQSMRKPKRILHRRKKYVLEG